MGFSPPIPQKDSDWEIRVAVLLSLFLQMLLIFVGPVRKRSSSPFPRFIVWSCYLLADWVADLALGLLLNNMGNIGGNAPGGSSSISHASGLKRGPAAAASSASDSSGSPIIFAFWTPFLLLHLGGPDTITAYALEDNELWLRHLIGLLFELFSACVIFFCSLKSNPMIPATVLMFVVGIVKYGERTYSLYSGSVDGFRENILGDPDPGPNYAKLMTEFDAKDKAGLVVEISIADNEAMKEKDELEDSEKVRLLKESNKSLEAQAYEFFLMFRRLFVNLILSYRERRLSQAYFLERPEMTPTVAFQVVEVELNFIYDMVYTKEPVAHTKAGCVLRFLGSACIVSSLIIFFFHQKGGFAPIDVFITYALLLGGLALDAAALAMLLSSHRMLVFLEEETTRLAWLARAIRALRPRQRRWSERTSQLNLVSYCLGKPDPYEGGCRRRFGSPRVVRALAKVAETLRVREIFDDFFFIRRERLCFRQGQGQGQGKGQGQEQGQGQGQGQAQGQELLLLKFVFDGLKDKAIKAKSMKDEEMTEVCSYRGEGVLNQEIRDELVKKLTQVVRDGEQLAAADEGEKEDPAIKKLTQVVRDGEQPAAADEGEKQDPAIMKLVDEKINFLVRSVQRAFDESLLLWHIATDLCFHRLPEFTPENAPTGREKRPIAKTLSEYMLYLLIKQPEMLSAAAGIGLLRYRDTCAEAQRFFESAAAWDPDHEDARKMLLNVNTSKEPSKVKGDRSKSVLFDAVILAKALRELGEDLMWEVVAGVWGEMLTYAAGKCRGSTHVRQLSRGGELITIVWYLMAHMGLGDMYQIHGGDASAKLIVHDQ